MAINQTKKFLLSLPRFIKQVIAVSCDALICTFTVWLAFGLRLDEWDYFQINHWRALIAAIGFSLPLFITFGLYRAIFRYNGSAALASMAQVFIIYTALFFGTFTLIGINGVPRSIGLMQPILLFIGIGTSRYFVRYWLGDIHSIKNKSHAGQSIAVIYGAGSAGRQLAAAFFSDQTMLIKAFIDDDIRLQGSTINGVSVHSNAALENLIYRFNITDVLLAIPSASPSRRAEIIASLNARGVRVRTLPALIDIASGRVKTSELLDLDMNDLLGRVVVPPELELLKKNICNKVVLVTGAGGSIGSELCRQIMKFSPKSLILIDSSESSLYLIYEELKKTPIEVSNNPLAGVINDQTTLPYRGLPIKLIPCLVSVRDFELLMKIFREHQPSIVFHAAAYKHVPLVEQNPAEGIRNNVFGTRTCAQVSLKCGVTHFILVSTDKAVRPTNIMGASKRIAELVLQSLSDAALKGDHVTNFSMVRFGNVLGSSGSVAPLFKAQIAVGGPITLTHPEVTRYFMTIPEAAQLVIQASAMATGGDVFILDMGEPVRIYDLARKMVFLSGLMVKDDAHPHGDIEIKVTGLRPGEKLYEELLIGNNPQPTAHPRIMKAHEEYLPWDELQQELDKLSCAMVSGDDILIRAMLKKLVPGYQPNSRIEDLN